MHYASSSTTAFYCNNIINRNDRSFDDSIDANSCDIRFYCNYKPKFKHVEKYVLTLLIDSELEIKELITSIAESLTFFFENYQNICNDKTLEDKYIELLRNTEIIMHQQFYDLEIIFMVEN